MTTTWQAILQLVGILAEALMCHWGAGRFRAFSAGTHPAGRLDPKCVSLLQQLGVPTAHLRSKNWTDFDQPNAPIMDFVFTVCDQAAQEAWPSWPGDPITAHWSLPDPQQATGSLATQMAAHREVFGMIERRVKILASLRLRSLRSTEIQAAVGAINGIATEPRITEAA